MQQYRFTTIKENRKKKSFSHSKEFEPKVENHKEFGIKSEVFCFKSLKKLQQFIKKNEGFCGKPFIDRFNKQFAVIKYRNDQDNAIYKLLQRKKKLKNKRRAAKLSRQS